MIILKQKDILLKKELFFAYFMLLSLSPVALLLKSIGIKESNTTIDTYVMLTKRRINELKRCKRGQPLPYFKIVGPINTGFFRIKVINYFKKNYYKNDTKKKNKAWG